MKKVTVKWMQLFFCCLWFLGALLVLVLYYKGALGNSIPVPRFIAWLYDLVGIVPASIIQLVLTLLGIWDSFSKKTSE